ncbi:hypothetical protein GTQ34_15855 [Muricauda sp. JGD-17]|uniref:Uncharacterized protein n=1 Tax=Flagellimonas ochracea TaxID=2696472 RepID=A0A964WYN3_9FLAO|nr:hypothetical protein [Allomuricauda ochracea]NAY93385.1 hypothetical protein [Allomuricauda ochracea]
MELWKFQFWSFKIYIISELGIEWDSKYILIAKEIVKSEIPKIEKEDEHHRTGFITIHLAKSFNQIIFDWWASENELRHLVFKAYPEDPFDFKNITSSGKAFCIWELKVIGFERDSWCNHILKKVHPSFDKYINEVLDTDE